MSPTKKKNSGNSIKINNEQFDKLANKLDLLIKLTAANIFQGENMKKGILFLSNLGFPAKEVANILGTTDHYVHKVNYEAKKITKEQETEKTSNEKEKVEKPQ